MTEPLKDMQAAVQESQCTVTEVMAKQKDVIAEITKQIESITGALATILRESPQDHGRSTNDAESYYSSALARQLGESLLRLNDISMDLESLQERIAL